MRFGCRKKGQRIQPGVLRKIVRRGKTRRQRHDFLCRRVLNQIGGVMLVGTGEIHFGIIVAQVGLAIDRQLHLNADAVGIRAA